MTTGHLAQEGVALAQDAVDVAAHAVELGAARHEQVVEIPAAQRRAALHDLEVVGSEHRHPQRPEEIACPRQALAVDEHSPTAGPDLGLDQHLSALAFDVGAHDGGRRPRAHERFGGGPSEALEQRGVGNRLEEVRLSLAVVTDDRSEAGGELDIRGRGSFESP